MALMQSPSERIILTRERFEELLGIEKAAAEFRQVLLDFSGTRLEPGEALVEISATNDYAGAILKVAFGELTEALSKSTSITA